jgi:drug/metabolite transporter (DMT)-like permease
MKSTNILLYIILLGIGVSLFCVGGFVLTDPELKSISGLCIGIGAGLFGMSIGQIFAAKAIAKNPNYKHKLAIEEKDERNIYINNAAKGKAFDFMGIALGILMLIYALIELSLLALILLVAAYSMVYIVYIVYLSKYSKEM